MSSHVPIYGNFFKFEKDDVYHNRIKTYPKVEFLIFSGSAYLNNGNQKFENFHTPNGHINLYDLNVYRNLHSSSTDTQLIYPFITKNGSFNSFGTITTDSHNLDFALGDTLSSNYSLTSSITIDRYDTTLSAGKKSVLYALRNTLDYYTYLSPHYAYSSSWGEKENQKLNIVSIPSIFYGSSIQKGSVRLKYHVTGTLLAEAADSYKDGTLYQTSGSTTGSVVGVVLYNEGFIILTSSTNLGSPVHTEIYDPLQDGGGAPSATNASWHYYGVTNSAHGAPSSSFNLEFNGINYIETVTMFAHAKENQLNFSNNPTFLTGAIAKHSGSDVYHEDAEYKIKNIVSSSYKGHRDDFKPVTYISKIGIYDKDKNLIAVAGLANPVRKLEDRSYTFKLKLDI